jgi:hypothetical protein
MGRICYNWKNRQLKVPNAQQSILGPSCAQTSMPHQADVEVRMPHSSLGTSSRLSQSWGHPSFKGPKNSNSTWHSCLESVHYLLQKEFIKSPPTTKAFFTGENPTAHMRSFVCQWLLSVTVVNDHPVDITSGVLKNSQIICVENSVL